MCLIRITTFYVIAISLIDICSTTLQLEDPETGSALEYIEKSLQQSRDVQTQTIVGKRLIHDENVALVLEQVAIVERESIEEFIDFMFTHLGKVWEALKKDAEDSLEALVFGPAIAEAVSHELDPFWRSNGLVQHYLGDIVRVVDTICVNRWLVIVAEKNDEAEEHFGAIAKEIRIVAQNWMDFDDSEFHDRLVDLVNLLVKTLTRTLENYVIQIEATLEEGSQSLRQRVYLILEYVGILVVD